MTITAPVRLDRMQELLVTVFQDAVGSNAVVAWAYQEGLWEQNFPAAGAVNLTMSTGPTYSNRNAARGTLTTVPTVLTFTVDTAAAGFRYFIELNNFMYSYDASGGDSVTDIRDALLITMNADTESPYSSVSSGVDSIVTTPDVVGDIWQARVSQRITGTPTISPNYYLLTRGERVFNIAVGCFSRGRAPRNGAWALQSQCEAALTAYDNAELSLEYGVGFWGKGPAIDLSDLDNGHWMSRVQFDLTVAMQSVFTRQVSVIESADITLNLSDPSATVTFTVAQ